MNSLIRGFLLTSSRGQGPVVSVTVFGAHSPVQCAYAFGSSSSDIHKGSKLGHNLAEDISTHEFATQEIKPASNGLIYLLGAGLTPHAQNLQRKQIRKISSAGNTGLTDAVESSCQVGDEADAQLIRTETGGLFMDSNVKPLNIRFFGILRCDSEARMSKKAADYQMKFQKLPNFLALNSEYLAFVKESDIVITWPKSKTHIRKPTQSKHTKNKKEGSSKCKENTEDSSSNSDPNLPGYDVWNP